MTGSRSGESVKERRNRLLRNTLVGAGLGGGAGYAFSELPDWLNSLMPPATKADQAAEAVSKTYAAGQPVSSAPGRMMSFAGAAGANHLWHRRGAAKDVTRMADQFLDRFNTQYGDARQEAVQAARAAVDAETARVNANTSKLDSAALSELPKDITNDNMRAQELQRIKGRLLAEAPNLYNTQHAYPTNQHRLALEEQLVNERVSNKLNGLAGEFRSQFGKALPRTTTNWVPVPSDNAELLKQMLALNATGQLRKGMVPGILGGKGGYTGSGVPTGWARRRWPGITMMAGSLALPEIASTLAKLLSKADDIVQ